VTDPADVLPLPLAARELGISTQTLRRWLRQGAPQARRGRRGRGGRALVDPAAVAAWRGGGKASGADFLTVFACEVPELVAVAVLEAHQRVEGPHKRATAGVLAGAWYLVSVALLDRLRRDVPGLADPATVPPQIAHLRDICDDASRSTGTNST